ncbi:MFS transporter [Lactiplantibacillus pentosus]|uniref:MFS transporter n=1 Tax=Lactiplantibacillus pentosus TaxID=1589 RepID=UPI00132FE85E|nr:MFS transporter [Lactiplantibacillus pentosus]
MATNTNSNRKYYVTALALYFAYFILGIASSIMGQYKTDFAKAWGATTLANGTIDVSMVVSVIAAYGLGRLIAYPFAGPVSDKIGRRISGFIGIALYAVFFFGMISVHSMWWAYAIGIVNGIANSFLNTCVSPSVMEIFPKSASIANLFTKFAITVAQFILPFVIGLVASAQLSYKVIFIGCGILMIADAILVLILPFPQQDKTAVKTQSTTNKSGSKHRFTPASIASILIGFTSSATFMIWLNCNQELGASYGIKDPSTLQSFYAVAGGVLQLATSTTIGFFPDSKGLATSLVMIASSVANYVVLSAAAYLTKVTGASAPRMIILMNVVITLIGVGLAIIVKYRGQSSAVSTASSVED